MRGRKTFIRLTTAAMLSLSAYGLLAQTGSDSESEQPAAGAAASVSKGSKDSGESLRLEESKPDYAAALNGLGLIEMNGEQQGLLFSATGGGGWDSNPGNTEAGSSAGVYMFSPYVGLHKVTPRTQSLVQYQPTFLGYFSNYGLQTLQSTSAAFIANLSERWDVRVSVNGSHGDSSARFIAGPQSVAVGGVPGVGSSSASFLSNAGTVTYVGASGELLYRRSERGTIVMDASNTYNSTSGFSRQGSVAAATLSYVYQTSPTVSVNAYGRDSHYYGDLRCEAFGLGAGVTWQMAARASVSLRGGPEINSSDCGVKQGYSYNVSFSARTSKRSQMYVTSSYLPSVSYLGPGLWQRTVSGGFQYQVTAIGAVGVDAGYASSDTLAAVNSYRGGFVDAHYGFTLRHGLMVNYAYRGYLTNSAGSQVTRNLAQFSLTWTSHPGRVFQSGN